MVLALERDWHRPYHELLELWTIGALLIGVGALPAGWLADRWSAPGMLAVMFAGMGGAALACAAAPGPGLLEAALAGLGLFAAIYHPVGIAWIVRSSEPARRGRALGVNGVFGNIGVAAAALLAGALIDVAGWRVAFVVPGVVSLLAGAALGLCLAGGAVGDERPAALPERDLAAADTGGLRAGFALLMITMASVGVVFQATQTALPKHFERRLAELLGSSAFGVGAAVGAVYLVAGLTQLVGGRLADRRPLRRLYAGGLALQAPVLLLLAAAGGWPLLPLAAVAALLNSAVLPAENLLLARFAPARHQSLAYGAKFVVAFSTAPLAVQLVSWVDARTGGLESLFVGLALAAGAAALVARALPEVRPA